jgi:hypothetical protein
MNHLQCLAVKQTNYISGYINKTFLMNGNNGNGNGAKPKGNRPNRPNTIQKNTADFGNAAKHLKKLLSTQLESSELRESFIGGTEYIYSMIDLDDSDPIRLPDEIVATSALFKAPYVSDVLASSPWNAGLGESDVKWDNTQPGQSTVLLFPGIVNAIWQTAGVDQIAIPAGAGNDMSFVPALVPNPAPGDGGYLRHALLLGKVGIIPRLDNGDVPWYELQMGVAGAEASPWAAEVAVQRTTGAVTISEFDITVNVVYFDDTTDSFGLTFNGDRFSATFNMEHEIRKFSVNIRSDEQASNWQFAWGTKKGTSTEAVGAAYSACNYFVNDVPQMSTLTNTSMERPTALTGLLTFMGSSLANGGKIAAARLPPGISVANAPSGDYFQYLASLPLYNGDYPLKKGAYAWWCPESEQEVFFRGYLQNRSQDLSDVTSLVFSMTRDEPQQSVRLEALQAIETLTRSITYLSKVSRSNPTYPKLIEMAKEISAVHENPTHKSFFSQAFNRVKGFLTKPDNWRKFLSGAMNLVLPKGV